MEDALDAACASEAIPGAVLCATNASGSFTYARGFGVDPTTGPLHPDSILLLASCTKLLTSIAALQCVERNLVGLDDDTAPLLPELAALPVLASFGADGKPRTAPRQRPITLRCV